MRVFVPIQALALVSFFLYMSPNTCGAEVPALIGVTKDNQMMGREEQDGTWSSPQSGSCCITSVAFMPDGSLVGVGEDQQLYTKKSYEAGQWSGPVEDSGNVVDVTVMDDGTLLGIQPPKMKLVSRDGLSGKWEVAPHEKGVVRVDVMPDGRIVGASKLGSIKIRNDLNGKWVRVSTKGVKVDDIAVQPNGKLIGIRKDTCTLHMRDMNGGPGPWTTAFPNSDCAKSIVSAGNIIESEEPSILTTPGPELPTTEAPAVHLVNIATEGTASQSSYYPGTNANRIIDGNTLSTWGSNSCSSTNSNQNAWWKVDLGQSYAVSKIILTNRQDCCSERLLNAEVRVGDSEDMSANTRCGELVGADRVNDETLTFLCDGLVTGRYVSVQLVDRTDYLNICEVQVMVPEQTDAVHLVNIATGGTASQSSYYPGTNANRIIDGNTLSTWGSNSCSSTNSNQNAWWKVDLGQSYAVSKIILTNRQDCCSERLLNAEVRVGDSEDMSANTRCGELVGADRVNDETLTFPCDGLVTGRYVSVQLVDRTDYLNICEVRVMVPEQTDAVHLVNIATGGTASQSSYYPGTNANRIIDGNTLSTWGSNSCSSTNSNQNAWWKVDLGQSYAVSKIILTNRQDCCSERLLNAEVRVGDSEDMSANTRCGELVGADRVNDETLTFLCDGLVTGRYVSVQLVDRTDYLNICEVRVMVPE
ncbi:uncharacterized protein LOC144444904 [Glandiceps talaboti]